jgi:hypothetical protein
VRDHGRSGDGRETAVDVMSPLDSAFLRLEDRHTSLHIASIAIFDGPPPSYEEIAALLRAKLPLLPRYRQCVREVPLWLGQTFWVDDRHFSLQEIADRNIARYGLLPQEA